MTNETERSIAAVLTPAGVGAIAVVRLKGPRVLPFLDECFSKSVVPDRCVHGELVDNGKVIDDPVVVVSSKEQIADINLHGGTWVVQAFVLLAERFGFSFVDARSMPLPALSLDTDDEIEAEILAYLPLAITELALRVLLAQSAAWERLAGQLLSAIDTEQLLADRSLHWLLHPPRVAIVGIPNAGKSTLANQLFGQQRSITADLPGTTRDWVGEMASLDGLAVYLIDTPGIRASEDAIETQAIERAGGQLKIADAIVLVMDATRLGEASQSELIDRFPDAIKVFNKTDASATVFDDASIRTVATKGEGIDKLRSAIRRRFHCEAIDLNAARCWTERQRQIIRSLSD